MQVHCCFLTCLSCVVEYYTCGDGCGVVTSHPWRLLINNPIARITNAGMLSPLLRFGAPQGDRYFQTEAPMIDR